MKKKGNDGKLYLSQPDKNGTYKWLNVNKNVNKSVSKNNGSKKDLQMLAKKYSVTKSGSNRELAERLVRVKGFVIKNKRDRKIIEQFLKTQTHHAKVYGFEPAKT